ncbi:Ferric uptake regulation protein [Pelotomaculum schinkii]|uniref:Ferric uptake regulation protein n=1 Tax=Pelotomaculum schinkii TaxID=78350 RepID=A0A4Y7RCF8_9FIRM|nr:Fur family transcriptional regulator [Pelotomaculum schinkii]TEB06512.1 Ferric uptake regulation protein [Pelotomaculum schinkii]
MKEQQLVEQLRRNGYKITPQRQEILKAFMESSSRLPQSAEDIHNRVVEKYPNVSLDTIYRNLNVLEGLEIISRLSLKDGKSRYELNPGGSHQHHLICLGCGAAEAIDYCPLKALHEIGIAEEKKFEIREHSFEIFGYCSLCRERSDEIGKLPGKCS